MASNLIRMPRAGAGARIALGGLALAWSLSASAQFFGFGAEAFSTDQLQKENIPSQKCTGFWRTPSFKCEDIKVPAYFARVKDNDRRALVIVAPGASGLDKRHSDYARHLVDNGINALVIDPWRARGMNKWTGDYQRDRAVGGDAVNMAIDAVAIASQLHLSDEWKDAKIGFVGESMGGAAAINATRPYIEAIVQERMGLPVFGVYTFDAAVSLYPGCTERVDIERFKNVPLLIISGELDDVTPASTCERQTRWMNERGGDVTFKVLPGQSHDWDAPFPMRSVAAENAAKCSSMRVGNKFILEWNQKEFPGTPEGFRDMRNECRTHGHLSGHRGDPRTGFDLWLSFFNQKLLGMSSEPAHK